MASGFMGPHPRSHVRARILADPEVLSATGKDVSKFRAKGYWNWSSQSVTCPKTSRPEGQDYKSHESLTRDRKKHTRTDNGPQSKFLEPIATSHEVGWLQNDLTYPGGSTIWMEEPSAPVR